MCRQPARVCSTSPLRYSKRVRNHTGRSSGPRAGLGAPLAVAMATLGGVVGGCQSGASVAVDITVPRPLVEQRRASVGVYFEDALTTYAHVEDLDEQGAYEIDIGASQAPVFAQVFDALFADVILMEPEAVAAVPAGAPEVEEQAPAGESEEQAPTAAPTPFRPADGGEAEVLGVLAPMIEEVQFATPRQTGNDFFEVWVRYQMRLFDMGGALRDEWQLIGYGKAAEQNYIDQSEAINAAATWALRDAAAMLAFELHDKTKGAALQQRDAP